jgi:hypothetical protein
MSENNLILDITLRFKVKTLPRSTMNRIRNISKFHIKKLFKSTIKSSLVALLTVSFGLAHAQNFPQIKTFGFDYADLNSLVDQGKWLAARHDWIVGSGPNQITPTLLNAMRSVNPDVKVMKYLAYHSVASDDAAWMENWCQQNGYNPEDLYYHYYVDTDVRLVTGGPRHVPGYGGGTATSLKEARLRVRWNGGAVGIDPSSPTWRAASQAAYSSTPSTVLPTTVTGTAILKTPLSFAISGQKTKFTLK